MANVKRKNVLMTTMSILIDSGRVNYYYVKAGDRRKDYLFCEGISSLEQGTKYFLSKYPIDEIVVVGTKETINKLNIPDRMVYDDFVGAWDELLQKQKLLYEDLQGKKVSAFHFYKYRIASFLKMKGHWCNDVDIAIVEAIEKNIADTRKLELEKLYEEVCPENPFLLEDNGTHWNEIKGVIEHNIETHFKDGDTYKKYISRVDGINRYCTQYWHNEKLANNYGKIRESITNDSTLSTLEKEYLYVSLREKVTNALNENRIKMLENEIAELEAERDLIQYKYNVLKNNRKEAEFAYIQYLAYSKLRDCNRLIPLPENTDETGKKISLRFVDEQCGQDEMVDNITGIVKTLYGDGDKEINLYIDMQGGNRTSSYVRNAIMSVLSNQQPTKVYIREIIGTNFSTQKATGNEIVNETNRYRVLDLVSGMNSFVRYGKADIILNYCKEMGISDKSRVSRLVRCMVDVDDAISLCNTRILADAIIELRELLSDEPSETKEKDGFVENVFQILKDGIKNDYGNLLDKVDDNSSIDYVELISWCVRKGFIQQALTLIEDKMPTIYFQSGMLRYFFVNDSNKKAQECFMKMGASYEKRIENKVFYMLQDKALAGPTVDLIWYMQSCEEVKKRQKQKDIELQEYKSIAETDFRQIHKWVENKILERVGCKKSIFYVKEDQLEELKRILEIEKDDANFVKVYCQFRRMEKDFESREYARRSLTVPGTIYDIGKDKICAHEVPVYYSIIGCLGKKKYSIKDEQNNKMDFEVLLSIDEKLSDYKDVMEEAFLLHDALKLERNCSNHASEKGIRLPSRIVKKAIKIYVQDIVTLLQVISRK